MLHSPLILYPQLCRQIFAFQPRPFRRPVSALLQTMALIHTPVPALKLNDGSSLPMIAYGTGTAWSKRSIPETEVDKDLVEGIKTAIKMGYRHFDCADGE